MCPTPSDRVSKGLYSPVTKENTLEFPHPSFLYIYIIFREICWAVSKLKIVYFFLGMWEFGKEKGSTEDSTQS